MSKKLYIIHEPVSEHEGIAYFGPFDEDEMTERLNDAMADMFADSGNIEEVELSDEEIKKFYVNPREWWMEQLQEHCDWERLDVKRQCYICMTVHKPEDLMRTPGERGVCDKCAEKHHYCNSCGSVEHQPFLNENGQAHYKDDCLHVHTSDDEECPACLSLIAQLVGSN